MVGKPAENLLMMPPHCRRYTRRARNSKTADALFVVRQASFYTDHMIFLNSSVSCSQSPTHVCEKSGAEEEVGEHSVHSKVDAK